MKPFNIVLLTLAALMLFSSGRRDRLGDLYDCYIIVDAEFTEDGEAFEQVDYEDLLNIVVRAKRSHIAFEPRWQVNLYDDDGIRYHLYVSKTATFLRIDSNYFRLSNRQSRRLRHLLGS